MPIRKLLVFVCSDTRRGCRRDRPRGYRAPHGRSQSQGALSYSPKPFIVLRSLCFLALRPLIPNRRPCFLPLHFHSSFIPSGMEFFRMCLPARLVPGPPRRLLWIGTPSRPHLPSPIVLWPSGEAQDIPSRKRPRISLPIPLRTIRERVRIYGTTAHIPDPSTKVVTAAARRFSEPWRPPKKDAAAKKNSGTASLN